jgi:hypothetical protein
VWTIDGREIGSSADGEAIEWPLERGRHRAAVRDARGRIAEAWFLVK